MQVVILCGGRGTRLAPYTTVFPKPLVPIGDIPILEIIVRQLRKFGFRDLIFATGHLAELIQAYFGDGDRFGVRITYSREESPLGTAGPLTRIKEYLQEPFLVMNGDLLTNIDYRELTDSHKLTGAMATIGTYSKPVKIDLGVVETNSDGELTGYIEKPTLKYQVSMGIYAFDPKVLDVIPSGRVFDFPDLVHTLLGHSLKVRAYPFAGYWLDIGRPDDYERAVEEFHRNRGAFNVD